MRRLRLRENAVELPCQRPVRVETSESGAGARWLLRDSRLLILDEPSRGVDIGAKGEIYELIDKLARARKAILAISSDLPEAIKSSDRVLVMRGGRIVHQLPSYSATEEEVMLHATGTFTSQSENAMDNNKPVTEPPVKAPFDFAKWWDRVGILIVLLVLLILMSTFAPNFNRVDNLLNIARSISVNAILAAAGDLRHFNQRN